jgi:plastocyanin
MTASRIARLAIAGLLLLAPAGAARAGAAEVGLEGTAFAPSEATVRVGETVTWTHRDGLAPHSVTADDGSFDSHPTCAAATFALCMRDGDTYSHTFPAAGRFSYYCRTHGGPDGQGMSGVVVVEP